MKRALLLMILSCLAVSPVTVQDPVKVTPKHYKVAEVTSPGSISPDGRYLSYEGVTGPSDGVFVLDLKTGERRRLCERMELLNMYCSRLPMPLCEC